MTNRLEPYYSVCLERPKTATVGIDHTARQTATFAIHQGMPYRVVAWEGSRAKCVQATHEEVEALHTRLTDLGLLEHFLA